MNNGKMVGFFLAAVILVGCSNPADKVPAASVSKTTSDSIPSASQSATPADARFLVIDTNASSVGFVASKVTRSHTGGFRNFEGELQVAGDKIADTGNRVVIDIGSIYTDTAQLTDHLKSPDFFDAKKFPTAIFTTATVAQNGTNATVTGDLTMHGVKKQISFPAQVEVTADSASINAEFSINRLDFNMQYPGKADDLIRKEVVLKLNVKAAPGRAKFGRIETAKKW